MKIRRVLKFFVITIVCVTIAAYAFVRFIVLDEQQLKEKLSKLISAHFQRDETDIENVDVGIFNSVITLKNVRIKQRYDYHGAHPNLLTISELTISFDRWQFLRSRGRLFTNLNAVLIQSVLIIEREKDGVCNIDDLKPLLAAFNPARFVDAQSCSITIKDGALKLIQNGAGLKTIRLDTTSNAGETWTRFCGELAELRCPCLR